MIPLFGPGVKPLRLGAARAAAGVTSLGRHFPNVSHYLIGYSRDSLFVFLRKKIEVTRINTRKTLRRRSPSFPRLRHYPSVLIRIRSLKTNVTPCAYS